MPDEPWIVSDELWYLLVEPLIPKNRRRFRYPGRKRLPDRRALCEILFVLHTGIAWRYLPKELGFGSGVTGWRRLAEWQQGGVWARLHDLLLTRLSGKVDWSRAIADSSHATMSLSSCRSSTPYRSYRPCAATSGVPAGDPTA
jgi:transposase